MNQVQDSSDCCIHSKFSSAHKGYFQDNYLSLFIRKLHPRSPLINRGYYIRFKAIEKVFQSYVKFCLTQKFQVISLGAGYDSSYLRLKRSHELPQNIHFIEIDFPEVLQKKLECVKELLCPERNVYFEQTDPAIVFSTNEYSMLGIDLTDINSVEKYLLQVGVDFSAPTLFLSECCITYMDPKESEKLIVWIQSHFSNSSFVVYEQIYPDDAFGIIMRNHFTQVGCSLKSITKYPNEESQQQRFKKLGWTDCSVITMYELFLSLPPEERQRVRQLELFDEYEMWHEKCHHYILLCASQGMLSNTFSMLPASHDSFSHTIGRDIMVQRTFDWKCEMANDIAHRFGHQAVPLSASFMLLSGGFGPSNRKHRRLGDIVVYDMTSQKHLSVPSDEHSLGERMFHSMTPLSSQTFVVLGGRSSPKNIFEQVLVLTFSPERIEEFLGCADGCFPAKDFLSVSCSGSMPIPTWRHSASPVTVEGKKCIFLFGGCSHDQVIRNECFLLNTETWKWLQIDLQECTPSARHSHSSATWNGSHVIISGGLSEGEIVLQSVHVFNCESFEWTILNVSGLVPRYSHTSHVWRDHLFMLGGVTATSSPKLGIGVINLKTLQAFELSLPAQDPEYPILLCNHSSYIWEDKICIVGGGGNCFSFGTHFNKKIAYIDVESIL